MLPFSQKRLLHEKSMTFTFVGMRTKVMARKNVRQTLHGKISGMNERLPSQAQPRLDRAAKIKAKILLSPQCGNLMHFSR